MRPLRRKVLVHAFIVGSRRLAVVPSRGPDSDMIVISYSKGEPAEASGVSVKAEG